MKFLLSLDKVPMCLSASGEAQACPICHNELLESDETQLLMCGHMTHVECINLVRV